MHSLLLQARIKQLRRFDRFYERRMRERHDRALDELSITEMQVFYELGVAKTAASPAWLNGRLRLDRGYLSRILLKLSEYGWLVWNQFEDDRRCRMYELTPAGRAVFESLERFHDEQACRQLEKLPERDQAKLVDAMKTIETILGRDPLDLWIDSVLRRRPGLRRYARP